MADPEAGQEAGQGAGQEAWATDLRLEAVESLSDGIAVVRAGDLEIVLANRGWRALLRGNGTLPAALGLPEERGVALLTGVRRELDRSGGWRRTLSVPGLEGGVFDCRLSIAPSHHPLHRAVWVVGATDVSDEVDSRREVQRELARAEAERAELRRRGESRDRFLNLLAHELRTPLAAIAGHVDLLADGPDEATRRAVCDQVVVSLADLSSLVGRVSSHGALARDEIEIDPRPLRVSFEVKDVVQQLRPLLRRRALEVEVPDDLVVEADPRAVREGISQLVSNAVKYSAPGTPIRLSVSRVVPAEGSGAVVRVAVTDAGRGIAPSRVDRVFDGPQPQLASGDSDHGLGLGLAIVRDYVHLHGGRYGAESVLGEGATVWFELPQERPRVDRG